MVVKKTQNILITGANGFVGRALVKQLIKNKENKLFLVSRYEKFKVEGAKVFYGDLVDREFCKRIVKNIDIVYYLAGYKKNVAIHTSEPFKALSGNILPLLNFLEAVKNSNIKSIIYTSSVIVEYALSKNIQTDGYVIGKYINELILKTFITQTKIDVKIVRPAAVYGPGNDFNPEVAQAVAFFIIKTAESKDDLVLRGQGKRKIQFIYIDDLIDNLIAVKNSHQSFFIIGNDQAITIKSLVYKIIKFMGKKLIIRIDKNQKDKPTKLDKFNNLIKPKISLDVGLQKTINYWLEKNK